MVNDELLDAWIGLYGELHNIREHYWILHANVAQLSELSTNFRGQALCLALYVDSCSYPTAKSILVIKSLGEDTEWNIYVVI